MHRRVGKDTPSAGLRPGAWLLPCAPFLIQCSQPALGTGASSRDSVIPSSQVKKLRKCRGSWDICTVTVETTLHARHPEHPTRTETATVISQASSSLELYFCGCLFSVSGLRSLTALPIFTHAGSRTPNKQISDLWHTLTLGYSVESAENICLSSYLWRWPLGRRFSTSNPAVTSPPAVIFMILFWNLAVPKC